jgi:hypothetical protein
MRERGPLHHRARADSARRIAAGAGALVAEAAAPTSLSWVLSRSVRRNHRPRDGTARLTRLARILPILCNSPRFCAIVALALDLARLRQASPVRLEFWCRGGVFPSLQTGNGRRWACGSCGHARFARVVRGRGDFGDHAGGVKRVLAGQGTTGKIEHTRAGRCSRQGGEPGRRARAGYKLTNRSRPHRISA